MKATHATPENNLKSSFIKTSFIVTLLLLFIAQFTVAQTVWTVDNSLEAGAQFTSLQDAINAASVNDIIYIHQSPTNYGNVTVDKTLIFVGPGHNPANMEGFRASVTVFNITANADNMVIKGLSINSVLLIGAGVCHNLKILNCEIQGTVVGATGKTDNWLIEGNFFSRSFNAGITTNNSQNWNIRNNVIFGTFLNTSSTTIILTNNIFVDITSGSGGFFVLNSNVDFLIANNIFLSTNSRGRIPFNSFITYTFNNCMTYSLTGQTLIALPGVGNFDNTNPLFTSIPSSVNDFYNNDYNVNGVDAVNGGTDGTDLGLFGNNFPFDINGRPHSMPYPELMDILNSVIQPGQILNVDFKATQKY